MVKTKVTEIGSMVEAFAEEQLVILFGPEATAELRDICVIHEFEEKPVDALKVGGTIKFGEQAFEIIAVGSQANANFEELGHISIYFREEIGDILPGAIIVSPGSYPDKVEVGEVIEVL